METRSAVCALRLFSLLALSVFARRRMRVVCARFCRSVDPRRNRQVQHSGHGISGERHREWVPGMGPIATRGGRWAAGDGTAPPQFFYYVNIDIIIVKEYAH